MPGAGPDKKLCGAQRQGQPKGVTCRNAAGARTSHLGVGYCYRHGGSTPNHEAAAQVELAQQAVAKYGLPVEVDPAVALLQAVAASYGQVIYLRAKVAELDQPWLDDKPHVAWTMLKAEEKLHADVCRDAIKAGVERRAIELAENTARTVVEAFAVFARLVGLSMDDPGVRGAARQALALVAGSESA